MTAKPAITKIKSTVLWKVRGRYVLTSQITTTYGPETYAFRANEEGGITDWVELPGSSKGDVSHEVVIAKYEALTRVDPGGVMGYQPRPASDDALQAWAIVGMMVWLAGASSAVAVLSLALRLLAP